MKDIEEKKVSEIKKEKERREIGNCIMKEIKKEKKTSFYDKE